MFASIPIIWFGIYDQEVSFDELYKNPKYYTQGIVGKLFHSIRFWKWVFSGIFQAFIVYLLGYYCLDAPRHDGKINDLWSIGSMIYSCIVIVVNLKIFFSTNNHSIVSFMLFFLSILCYWIVLSIMSLYYRFENFNNFYMLLSDYWYYLATFAACVIIVTLDSGLTHLFYKLGVIKDGRSIEPGKIDEHLKIKIRETNKEIEQLMTIRCNYFINLF